jgi:gluconate 2-dehydrogenase gamma chain
MTRFKDDLSITRRTLIASATFVPLATLTAPAQAQAPIRGLSVLERKTLEAFVDRLIPADELGPGALQAGAAEYIDRCLADYLAAERTAIAEGLHSLGEGFADLSPEKRDAVLTSIQNQPFFNRVRRLTLEGMFGDPHYGGNVNFVGWDLIKYPGPRPAVAPEDQKMGVEIKPYHRSAWGTEHNGH